MVLTSRDTNSIQLELPDHSIASYDICHLFPFTSERKRMGIIVKVRPPLKLNLIIVSLHRTRELMLSHSI